MSTFIQDFKYAVRTIRRAPAFAFIVILTLGLGIGANTAIFSLMDQVMLRMLPVQDPGELVQLDGPGPFSGRSYNDRTFSYPMYVDLRDRNTVFAGWWRAFRRARRSPTAGRPSGSSVELVSGNTFDVLGVSPILGRALTQDDDRTPGAHPVALHQLQLLAAALRRLAGGAQSGRQRQQHAGHHRRRRAAGVCRDRRDADRPTSSCR